MNKIGKTRLIWEEILEEPFIYRIRESGSHENTYLIVSGDEALVIDPRSDAMLFRIRMLCRGLGAAEEKLKLFLTAGCTDGRMDAMLQQLPPHTVVYSACNSDVSADDRRAPVRDGIVLRPGTSVLHCIQTEGCARGLMSLWMDREGVLFCGDAVGCDHLPPVCMWDSRIDTLGLQFETLRRLRALPVQMILPGRGEPAGVDDMLLQRRRGGFPEPEPSKDCAAVLDDAVRQYCIRILEVYQRVPAKGGISAEKLEKGTAMDPDTALSCCKYLLYRRYLRYRESESGEAFYERGTMLLTDWGMQQT